MIAQRLIREGLVWSRVAHPNITPFLGVSFDFDRPGLPCLVSPYYRYGSITSYLKDHPHVNKLPLVNHNTRLFKEIPHSCLPQISQITEALSYLHDCSIIHGDIKGVGALGWIFICFMLTSSPKSPEQHTRQ
jgi:serine/threonine protein kinase